MPGIVDAFRGAASGAATGSLFGPWGTAIGGAVGLGLSFLGKSPEEERAERRAQLLQTIAKMRKQRLERGIQQINQGTAGAMANSAAMARRRAAAEGRSDVESLILPGQSNIASAGSQALSDFQRDTESYFDQQELGVETGFAGRPIEPGLTDVLEELGVAALQYKGSQDRIQAMKDIYGVDATGANATPKKGPTPTGYDVIDSQMQPVTVTPYSPSMPITPTFREAPIDLRTQYDNNPGTYLQPFDQSKVYPVTRSPRKPTSLVDAYRHAVGRR